MAEDAKFLKKHIKTGAIDVHPTEKALIVNYELEATILAHSGDPMAGERKNCQKMHIKTGAIDVHPTEKALIVNYELEATILAHSGDPMAGERKNCQKIIRLKDLNSETDVAMLAREVVERCKLIPQSKLPEVQQLLFYLQKRKSPAMKEGAGRTDNLSNASLLGDSMSGTEERASIGQLEEYIELLYEDIPERVRGTALVLQLARNPDNMEELLNNETLLGALARILREDWKQFKNNFDLPTNIAYIFYCFSVYSQFHPMISHFKVGALCMNIMEYEVKRHALWVEDLRAKRAGAPGEAEKNRRKFALLVGRQETLLRVSLALLLNLAEDVGVEAKMVKRGMAELLVSLLARSPAPAAPLTALCLAFAAKLARFRECQERLRKAIPSAATLLTTSEPAPLLSQPALRLLHNLSFAPVARKAMVDAGILPHVVRLVPSPETRESALQLLYHFSLDDAAKPLFTYTDTIALSMRFFLERSEEEELVLALLINLALCKRNAQLIAGDDGAGLQLIAERAFTEKHVLCLKLMRNIAEHEGPTKVFAQHFARQLVNTVRVAKMTSVGGGRAAAGAQDSVFALEALRVLAVLPDPDGPALDWLALLQDGKPSLLAWLQEPLAGKNSDEEWTLESVILLGAVAGSGEPGAELVLGLVDNLSTLLSTKQDDDEIVLQIIFVFYQLLLRPGPRQRLLDDTQIPAYIIDLLHDKNAAMRRLCENALELVAEAGEAWAVRIAEERFRWHNAQWLEMIADSAASRLMENGGGDRDEDEEFGADFAAEDVLSSFQDDRPYSRLDYRRQSFGVNADEGGDGSDDEAPLHPFTN